MAQRNNDNINFFFKKNLSYDLNQGQSFDGSFKEIHEHIRAYNTFKEKRHGIALNVI